MFISDLHRPMIPPRLQPRPSDHLACVRSNSSAVPSGTLGVLDFHDPDFCIPGKLLKVQIRNNWTPQKNQQLTIAWKMALRLLGLFKISSAYGMRSLNNPGRPYLEYLPFFVCTARNLGMGFAIYFRDSVSRDSAIPFFSTNRKELEAFEKLQ